MDSTEQIDIKNHPALILAGKADQTITHAHRLLQSRWCAHHGCGHCITCSRIVQHQHHRLLWLEPDDAYTRQSLEPLFEAIAFKLDDDEEFFCVLNHADRMSSACYNSLLKTLEEPHRGYHFVLLSERAHTLAPTIRSRCLLHELTPENPAEISHPIARFFTTTTYEHAAEFAQALEQTPPSEQESVGLIDDLLAYWIKKHHEACKSGINAQSTETEHVVNILEDALKNPPLSGSSQLFWRNLFVCIKK